MGQLAAKIDADAKRTGMVIPFEGLLIGVTALHLGYGIGTRNLRHFRMIPNLNVIDVFSHSRATNTNCRRALERSRSAL
jgi:predicted nucleic acid-binding protein